MCKFFRIWSLEQNFVKSAILCIETKFRQIAQCAKVLEFGVDHYLAVTACWLLPWSLAASFSWGLEQNFVKSVILWIETKFRQIAQCAKFFRVWGRSLFGSDSLLVTALISGSLIFVVFLQTKPQFSRISIVTFLKKKIYIYLYRIVASRSTSWIVTPHVH